MRSLLYSIFLFWLEWCQVSYLNFVRLIFYFYLWFHVDLSCLSEFHNSTNRFKLVSICRYICDIFVHAKICTKDWFIPNSSYEKDDSFCVSFLPSNDNWWHRAPMVSLFSWWFLRRFNLLRNIYVVFTNMYFCERWSYNPFNCTSVLFTIVF